MSQKTRTERRSASNLGQRIVRRNVLFFGLAFLLSSLIVALILNNYFRADQAEHLETDLIFLTELVEREINGTVEELLEVSASSVMFEYAEAIARVTTPEAVVDQPVDGQRIVLRDFDNLIRQSGQDFDAVRYISRDGRVWAEAINRGNEVIIQPYNERLLVTSPGLEEALNEGQASQPYLSQLTRNDETGAALLYVYVPVATVGNAQNILGTVQLVIRFDQVEAFIISLLDNPLIEQAERQILLLDQTGQVLANSSQGTLNLAPILSYVSNANDSFLGDEIDDQLVSANQITTFDGQNTPWLIVMIDNEFQNLLDYFQLIAGILALMALMFGLAVLLSNYTITDLLRPLGTTSATLRRLSSDSEAEDAGNDLNAITRSAQKIAQRIDDLNVNLDAQVERRNRDLKLASRIGREVATLYDIDRLLSQAVNLIADELGFYHAQVFLVDDARLNAVLVHSRGRAGQRLLERKFKIPVGSDTVIGTVTGKGEPVIVNDTGVRGVTHGFNPLLPETRAEIGIPLISGDAIIGALDIQSKEPNVFLESDLPIYTLLADQLAVAITNARLANQTDKRIQQIDTLNRQLTRAAWEEADRRASLQTTYRYNLVDVEKIEPQTDQNGKSDVLSTPITIRGEVIGEMSADPGQDNEFTEGDQVIMAAIANRVALAIENARLFQETQNSLTETSTLYQLSRYLNEANTLEDILQALIVSVMPEANSGQVWMFEDYERGTPEWIMLQADLIIGNRDENNRNLQGLRLRIQDHPFLHNMSRESVTLVRQSRLDNRIDSGLKLIFRRLSAEALVIIPLVVRGQWRGLITVGFPNTRKFTERESRIYGALTDQAGVAIDNRLLLRQTEQEVARNENLYAASRIINTAEKMQDLVYAAVATSNDPTLNFALSLLEGELDAESWPTRARMVAQSTGGAVNETDMFYPFEVNADSPMRNREPEIIIDDTPSNTNVDETTRWMREQGYRFMAVFPLFSANQPIALFHVASATMRDLGNSDYEVYRALTGQMSSQIQIRKLLERTEKALDETSRLYIASRALATAQDFEPIYTTTLEHLARPFVQLEVDQAIRLELLIAWPESTPSATHLERVYRWSSDAGAMPGTDRIPVEDVPFMPLMADQIEPLVVSPSAQAADMPELQTALQVDNVESLLVVPVRRSAERWFGVIACYAARPYTFDEQYVRFITAVADQMAIAIDNLQLVDEARYEATRAQTEAQRAVALAEAAQLSNEIGDEDVTQGLDMVFERIGQISGFDRWMMVQFVEGNPTLLETIINISDEAFGMYPIEEAMPVSDAVRLTRTIIVNDARSYPAFGGDENRIENYHQLWGKHIVAPVTVGASTIGAIVMGRPPDQPDLDDGDQQIVETLATQAGIALENRRLFQQTQQEQRNLRSILETLPAGMLVLDPDTLKPVQFNQQAAELLGREIDPDVPFTIENYQLHRAGTDLLYPAEEMPIYTALEQNESFSTDDVAIYMADGTEIDLLVNAAPIATTQGQVTALVVALQDITSLRSLENTLQENLRETVSLYEAQRQISGAGDLEEVLDVLMLHLTLQQPTDAYVIFNDRMGNLAIMRSQQDWGGDVNVLHPVLNVDDMVKIDNVTKSDLPPETIDALVEHEIASIMTLPLNVSSQDEPVGWLVVAENRNYGLGPDEERVLTQLRDVAAAAIDNRLLIQSQQATLNEVRSLYNATNSISRAIDVDDLVRILRESLETLDPAYIYGYLDESAGLQDGALSLFNLHDDDITELDIYTIMRGYDIPPGGVYISDLNDISETVEVERRLIDAGLRAFAAVELRPKQKASGLLFIGYRERRQFTETEDRYLNTLADGASVIFNTFILFDQIQGSLEETSTLYQAGRALTDARKAEDILDVVVTYLVAPHVKQVFIALLESGLDWSEPDAAVQIVAGWSEGNVVNLEGVTLNREEFPAWDMLSNEYVLTIDDIYDEAVVDEVSRDSVESLGARSVVIIPLRVSERAIGAVWIGSDERHRHNDREERTFQAFAEQASLSLEASYLLQQTERRARQLETSAQVSQNAAQILDIEELMSRVVYLIRDSFGYDHAQIFLMDEKNDWAELRASTGEAGEKLLAMKHKLQKGSASVIGQVTQNAEPTIALDTADADVVHKPNPVLPLTRSEMALPLIIKGEVIGALDVQSNSPNAFNQEDIRALTTLAAQISVAIDNANLYESAQQQADTMGFLFEVTAAAAAAETLDEALQKVAEIMQDTLDALSVVIYLPRTYEDELQDDSSYTLLEPITAIGTDQPLRQLESFNIEDQNSRLSEIARMRQVYVIEDPTREQGYQPVASEARSGVLIPLVATGQMLGLIAMEDARPNAYGREILQLLLTLTGSLSAEVQSIQLLEQLQRSNEQLRELDRLKSDFLANMSHELRTPLNSIIGFSRVMLKGIDGPLTEMQEQDLTTIYNSGQHLLMLINDVLDQAKIAAQKLDLKFVYFELKPLVEGVKAIAIGLVKEKPIDLRIELSPQLPKVYGDEFRTRQVLINLVSNASKFTSEGYIALRVYPVMTEDNQTMVRIDVEDTGIGISQKDQPLLFEAFRQVDSSLTRTAGGTGLGLPIAKSLTEMQGGQMLVESEVNVGSVFSITIPTEPVVTEDGEPLQAGDTLDVPLNPDSSEDESFDAVTDMAPLKQTGELREPAVQEDNDADDTRPDTQPSREVRTTEMRPVGPVGNTTQRIVQRKREVLLIEDNKDMVDQFRRALQREGFEVYAADHPAYAEAMASNLRPNLVIMDVNFSDGQGWSILEQLKDRDDTFDLPVIVVTLSDDSERAYRLGAHTFIQRPFVPDDLIEAVLKAEEESNKDRILIIDDEPEAIRLLTQLLNENGTYRVFSAETGIEGISMVARRRPDLIILDLRMPEMDGFEVLRELRNNPETSDIPVLVVTGEIDLKSEEQRQLANVRVLRKTDISDEEFETFIRDVRNQLKTQGE
jgi:PAS domain S-box-containing protein